jgi:HK97 gp10 family phage protein
MMSFGDLAKHFERAAADVRPRLDVALAKIGEHAAIKAAEMIGHELPQWPPLAQSTVAEKQQLGYVGHVSATDPLLRTGELRDSIRFEVEGLTVTVGSHEKIAAYHEFGTPRMPPRPFLAPAMLATFPYAEKVLEEAAVRLLTPGAKP